MSSGNKMISQYGDKFCMAETSHKVASLENA